VFYFRLYVANYYIIAMILICVWFKLFGSRRSSVRLSKVDAQAAALTVAVADGRG
jgi:hypothetical protein